MTVEHIYDRLAAYLAGFDKQYLNQIDDAILRDGLFERLSTGEAKQSTTALVLARMLECLESFIVTKDDNSCELTLEPLSDSDEKMFTHPNKQVASILPLIDCRFSSYDNAIDLFLRSPELQSLLSDSVTAITHHQFLTLAVNNHSCSLQGQLIEETSERKVMFNYFESSLDALSIEAWNRFEQRAAVQHRKKEIKDSLKKSNKSIDYNNALNRQLTFPSDWQERLKSIVKLIWHYHDRQLEKYQVENPVEVIPQEYLYRKLHRHEDDLLLGNGIDEKADNGIASMFMECPQLLVPLSLQSCSDNVAQVLIDLEKDFPNFYNVTRYVRDLCMFSLAMKRPLKLPNILLYGMPGTGKTAYAIALAEAVEFQNFIIPMSSLSTAGDLVGISSIWSTGQPGVLLEQLEESSIANPFIILDEIDKTVDSGGNCVSPNHVLLNLTEENTARRFKNPFLKTELNMSHINWIATANDVSLINPALKDRFKLFHIAPPSKDELRTIISNMYEKELHSLGLTGYLSETLPDPIIDALQEQPLRTIKEKLRQAMIRAKVSPLQDVDGISLCQAHFKDDTKPRRFI